MAWQVSKRVWDYIKINKNIKQGERLMLLALADIADENGICWPKFDTSYQTLADMTGVNRRSAMRIIDDLCKAELLIKTDEVGRGHSNIYAIIIGLTGPEKESTLSLIGVTHNTISNEESEGKKEEMVLPITPGGVTHNTIYGLNGVTHNTHPIIKSPSTPSLAKKDNTKPSKTKGEAQEMFKTLAEVCQYDLGLISNKERGQLNQAEKKMRDKGYTPDDLKAFEKWWYTEDWRGKQQQPPTLNQIRETWGRFRNSQSTNGRDSPQKPKFVIVPVTQESNEND